ncbi:hypothetical protein AcW1_006360 [Taiwanofungus camphoratus]|nr:hypothetical protein AcW2_005124 [Antrodia cinnamomea]KAI0954480.1 hypothetical protein AcW1_006360 [Antrodia cinnamomea]
MLAFVAATPVLFPMASPASSPSSSSPSPSAASHKRPRGLWKGRRDSPRAYVQPRPSPKMVSGPHDCPDEDDARDISPLDDDDDRYSSSSASSKRRRFSGPWDSTDSSPFRRSASGSLTPLSDSFANSNAHSRPSHRIMTSDRFNTPSTISPKGKHPTTADYEDWENLKELFARAAERYDSDDVAEALPLLRAVIRECDRFLRVHPDPSVIYADAHQQTRRSPESMTPTEERLSRDWGSELESGLRSHTHACAELPTAFHAVFGIALFFMGTLIAGDASLALPGEPDAPSTYWLAALDVFETGENLPSRTAGGAGSATGGVGDLQEDWRMAIVWGRTLVCLADEKVSYSIELAKRQAGAGSEGEYCILPSASPFSVTEPVWPAESPFAAIAAARPPVTRRMSLYSASAHDVMVLAMDQFSRGILHMPHPHYPSTHNPSHLYPSSSPHLRPHSHARTRQHTAQRHSHSHSHSHTHSNGQPVSGCSTYTDALASFSRPKELFTIASEVLGVAERLPDGAQRAYWAGWADSVFTQMKMEADMEAWRGPLTAARGRCWLVMGSAPVEELEHALESGQTDVLQSAEAEEAREGLTMAISFFERAKGSTSAPAEDVSPLFAEALFTLANITVDENKREELYSRAQAEAGSLDIDLDLDTNDTGDRPDDAMDES